jgi:5-methylcytosine-specific restriction enzyme subunit McrC
MSGTIPIQNIYYLLCYAWDQLAEGGELEIAAEDCHSLDELFARVLTSGTKKLLQRGLDRNYLPYREETASLKGRFDLTESMARQTWRQGRMVCEFDELSYDILHNRILKTTLSLLSKNPNFHRETRELLHHQLEMFHPIKSIRITSRLFRRVHLHRNNRAYRFLLNICELIHDSLLPTEQAGPSRFRDFLRDEKRMPYLFENFVRNFYRREQEHFKVGALKPKWNAKGSEQDLAFLPDMRTDVSLLSPDRAIIIDCKFYKEALKASRFDSPRKINSGNLYQLYTYLKSAHHNPNWSNSEGILLYPSVTHSFDHAFTLDQHPVRVCSVDLNQPWPEIAKSLLALLSLKPGKLEDRGLN